jgi:hypothetical protein
MALVAAAFAAAAVLACVWPAGRVGLEAAAALAVLAEAVRRFIAEHRRPRP